MELTVDLLLQMAYALGIGLLIGLERTLGIFVAARNSKDSWADQAAQNSSDATRNEDVVLGVRTFAVLSLVGYVSALLSTEIPHAAHVTMAGVCILITTMYSLSSGQGLGITTELAAIGTTLLGMLCKYNPHTAGVLALIITVLLASKRLAHSTIQKMRWVELTDTLKFLVIILVVLPILPNHSLDPYEAFNPYKVCFLVVLISGISFVGYLLTRILGAQRGLGIAGALGGLTSSTAVTAAMAQQAQRNVRLVSICAFSTVVANATMFARVLVVVTLLDGGLSLRLAWPIGSMALVALIAAGFLWLIANRDQDGTDEQSGSVRLENPFSLGPAIKFGAFFVGILFVAKLAKMYLGSRGLYIAACASGLADVDAITLTITEQVGNESLTRSVGAIGITIAVVSNSLVKTSIAFYSGGWKFGRAVGLS